MREVDFWSFRDQRDYEWHLGNKYKFKNIHFTKIDECISQFKKRCMEFPGHYYLSETDEWPLIAFEEYFNKTSIQKDRC